MYDIRRIKKGFAKVINSNENIAFPPTTIKF
jgi:hypothetical protein